MRSISAWRAALTAALVLLIYNLAPLALGTDALLERVPDDAFYYLVLCKNFARQGFWTFDGEHWASGFHLLFGYLIAGVYWIAPEISLNAMYALVVVLNTALASAAIYWLARVNDSLGLSAGNFALVLVAISSVGLRLPGFPMEACLVIFFSAAAFYLASPAGKDVRWAPVAAFAAGILGVLSRTDWGAMPFALLAGALAHMWWRGPYERGTVITLAALCMGAVAGEALVALHTYVFTGGIVQRSASVKHHWASVQGYTPLPGIARVVELLGPFVVPRPLMLAMLAGVLGFFAWRGWLAKVLDSRLALGSVLIILGYWSVYMLNGSVQYWYAATFFAAVAVLASAVWAMLPRQAEMVRPAVAALFLVSAIYQFFHPPWTWAPAMAETGRYLRSNPEIAPVGAWNAGIISFFAGRPVINLDGLVNDDVYPYVIGGRLHDYITDRNIAYVADFPTALANTASAKGGLVDSRLAVCSKPVRTFAEQVKFEGMPLTLYKVDAGCLDSWGQSLSGKSRSSGEKATP